MQTGLATAFQLNLLLAWLWIVLGFGAGFVLGMNFHREDWLGGYSSFRRRLCRLGHISFFGLAMVNLMFYFTAPILPSIGRLLALASWALIVGAISMPICCFAVAFFPKLRPLFLVPVVSLIAGAAATLWEIIKL